MASKPLEALVIVSSLCKLQIIKCASPHNLPFKIWRKKTGVYKEWVIFKFAQTIKICGRRIKDDNLGGYAPICAVLFSVASTYPHYKFLKSVLQGAPIPLAKQKQIITKNTCLTMLTELGQEL